MTSRKFFGIDLFCGCGGVTNGLIRAGVDVRVGIDFEESYRATYENNNKVPFLASDIRKVSALEILPFVRDVSSDHCVISSCAPCQPFSLKNGKRSHDSSVDPRVDLSFELLRIVSELEHEGIICSGIFIENVPEFSKSAVWQGVKDELLRKGFSVAYKVINCADYGVPQSRRRFIAFAVRGWCFLGMPTPSPA